MTADRPTLLLPTAVSDAIERHARDGAPDEVCGILAGRRASDDHGGHDDDGSGEGHDDDGSGEGHDDDGSGEGHVSDGRDEVAAHHPVANVADDPRTRYELDPEAALATIEEIEAGGDEVVGFYHSHPNGPLEPSATDERRATWPGYVYAIVVPGDGVRAWRWTGERFERIDLHAGPN